MRIRAALLALACLLLGVSSASSLVPTLAPDEDPTAPVTLLSLINRDRAVAGLAPMVLRDDVSAIALAYSHRMAEAGTLSHNDEYFTAASRARLDAKALAENVALNSSVLDAHARLMNSPGHRANILDPRMTVVGIGVVRDASMSNYITEDFLQPRAAENTVLAPIPAPPPAPAPMPTPEAVTRTAPAGSSTDATGATRAVVSARTPAPPAPSTTVAPQELPASTPQAAAVVVAEEPVGPAPAIFVKAASPRSRSLWAALVAVVMLGLTGLLGARVLLARAAVGSSTGPSAAGHSST
jgi:hypothetical protein